MSDIEMVREIVNEARNDAIRERVPYIIPLMSIYFRER
jgi:hypothetical protein